jgi:ABC-type uncharacterized transport system substrate-binding protein
MTIPDSKKSAAYHSKVDTSHNNDLSSLSTPVQRFSHSKKYSYIILLVLAFTLTGNVNAKEGNILILLSGNNDVYLDVATTITNSTIKMCRDLELACQDSNYEISQISSQHQQFSHDQKVIVTLGIKATAFAKKHFSDKYIFSALIPKISGINASSLGDNPNHYLLYLDQPLHRSMLLISALSNRLKHVGVMISSSDNKTEEILVRAAFEHNITLNLEKIDSVDQIGASLNRLLNNSDILLALPDIKIHNKSTVSNILVSAYRKRIPLIGFSSAYVKAGALAAIYSSHEDIAFHVRDNITRVFSGERIENREQNAAYFSILFNYEVARSLDFPTKSVDELEDSIIKRSKDSDD